MAWRQVRLPPAVPDKRAERRPRASAEPRARRRARSRTLPRPRPIRLRKSVDPRSVLPRKPPERTGGLSTGDFAASFTGYHVGEAGLLPCPVGFFLSHEAVSAGGTDPFCERTTPLWT